MSGTFTCSLCGEELPIADRIVFNGRQLCPSCYEEETVICDHCGERIWQEDNCGDENYTLCRDCEDCYYERCADCGRLVALEDLRYRNDDGNGYCESCYNRLSQVQGVRSYCYKPEALFYGDGTRYLGVELEIDGAGESNDHARKIRRCPRLDETAVALPKSGS